MAEAMDGKASAAMEVEAFEPAEAEALISGREGARAAEAAGTFVAWGGRPAFASGPGSPGPNAREVSLEEAEGPGDPRGSFESGERFVSQGSDEHADEIQPEADEAAPTPADADTLEELATSAPAAFSNAVVRYYVTDHLGSPRVVLDAQRQVLDRHDYEPFGVELTPFTDQADLTHRFTGHERDLQTGYDYMHFRFYGSSMGRFLKPDNIPGALMDPQSWNLYAYVRNNPANATDPTGHIWNTGFIGTDESQHPGAYPDNGEMPLSSAGLLPEGMGTIGSSEPLSFIISRLSAAGFSMAAIRYAISNQPDMSPSIALYTVHSNAATFHTAH